MTNRHASEYRISVDQLRPGVCIRLEKANWFSHPFLFSTFKIRDHEQIDVIKKIGVVELTCIPEKSNVLPLARDTNRHQTHTPAVETDATVDRLWEVKRERVCRLQKKKQRIAECEDRFRTALNDCSDIMKGIMRGDARSVSQGLAFVDRLADTFLPDRESTLHLMNVLEPTEQIYSHPLNVTILSMLIGRDAGLDSRQMRALGMGALFHDIGKNRIEKKLLRKRGNLTIPERQLMERHPSLGVDILTEIPAFPLSAIAIVEQHHEHMNGSGYPHGLMRQEIDRSAHMVAVANAYDTLCNQPEPADSLTPYEALSHLFRKQKRLYDPQLLTIFIRSLGIYPPGTVVQLSNGAIGMVMSVNSTSQLQPSVVLYDAEVPRREALIIELADDPDLSVEKSIRPAHLPRAIFDYLNPRTRISYFVELP